MDHARTKRARAAAAVWTGEILGHVRRRLADQSGFGLIEVVVSAALLAVVTLALLAGIDGPALVAARNQQRSIAANLAQQDQDRMRAMRAADLSNYSPPAYSVNVGGVNYSITSSASWTSDTSGTASCANNSALSQYLDIKSSVTWPANRGAPVAVESLVAPPNGSYNLIAQIQDQAGNPVVGLPISTTGPANLTRNTNSLGCAYFGNVPVGNYTASFSQIGWVDPAGVNNVSMQATVAKGGAASVTHQYGQAATIGVSFDTSVGGIVQAAKAPAITATNPAIPTPPAVRVYTPASPQTTITATSLFPFTDGYNVYAGTCKDSDPTYVPTPPGPNPNPGPNYFQTNPGHVATAPGGAPVVTVREPAINVNVTRLGAPYSGGHVTVTPATLPCSDTYPPQVPSAGKIPNPAFPFGKYTVCADDGVRKITQAVSNNTPAGITPPALAIPTSGSGSLGTCP